MPYNGNGNGNGPPGGGRVSEWRIRDQMCDIGQRMWMKGFCAGSAGRLSVRLSESRILCTSGTVGLGHLRADDLCMVDPRGRQLAGRRTIRGELGPLLEIFRANQQVHCIIQCRPPHAMALLRAGLEIPGTSQLAEAGGIVAAENEIIIYGADLEEVYHRLEVLEAESQVCFLAAQLGRVGPQNALNAAAAAGESSPQGDMLSRVCGEVSAQGRMATIDGIAPAPATAADDPIASAVAGGGPAGPMSDEDFEQLVQIITDQIMAAA